MFSYMQSLPVSVTARLACFTVLHDSKANRTLLLGSTQEAPATCHCPQSPEQRRAPRPPPR